MSSSSISPRNDAVEAPAKRRRGRPPKAPGDESTEKRRARVRRAQQAFRLRKEAKATTLESQNAELLHVIEQMSTKFTQFADVVIKSEALNANPEIAAQLSDTIKHFVNLSRVADLSQGHDSNAGTAESSAALYELSEELGFDPKSDKSSDKSSDLIEELPLFTQPSSDESIGNSLFDMPEIPYMDLFEASPTNNIYSSSLDLSKRSNSRQSQPPALPDLFDFTMQSLGADQSLIANSWINYGFDPYTHLPNNPELIPLTPADNGYRLGPDLLQTTTSIGYLVAQGMDRLPSNLAKGMYRFTMARRSRQETLFVLRWMLGPGAHELYRFGSPNFKDILARFGPKAGREGSYEVATCNTTWEEDFLSAGEYLNAYSIDDYLRTKGAVYIGKDVIKMSSSEIAIPELDMRNRVQSAFSFDALLGSNTEGTTTLSNPMVAEKDPMFGSSPLGTGFSQQESCPRMQPDFVTFSAESLMLKLAFIAICMEIGPGYPRQLVDQAITTSILESCNQRVTPPVM